mgnify:CR=1 FL=1
MTTTVQSIKYMQAIYRKYQIFAIACALLTIIAASLAAVSGIQLNNLRKADAKKLESATLNNNQANADVQKELKETKLFLKSSQQQLNEEKEKVERMQQMLNALERQLSAAQAKAAFKTDDYQPAPKPDKVPGISATPKIHKQPPSEPTRPAASPAPTKDEPKPDDEHGTGPAAKDPAPEVTSPTLDPSPAPPESGGSN